MSDITLVNAVFPTPVRVPPQGLLYLTASLEAAGFSVEIRDYQLCALDRPCEPETFARFLEGSARIVGISCMSYALGLVIAASRLLKAKEPDKFLVLGGIGPSGVAEPLMDYCREIDAIVVGEGERTSVELAWGVLRGENLAPVQGIVYRDNGAWTRTAPRPRIATLDQIPGPAYERIDLSAYRLVDIQYGRGCPYPCTFCDIAPYWGRKNTQRSMPHFLEELQALVQGHGAKDVFIVDDTFTLSRPSILQFCDGIRARGLDFEWGCYARIDLIDEPLMERMAEAGCRKVFYGIESGSDRQLQDMHKGLTVADTVQTVRRSLEFFPYVTTSFIWGMPTETLDDLNATAHQVIYMASLGACPQLNLVLPYSYSTLYRQYRDRITFTPDCASQLEFYEGTDREWLLGMIRERPDLFSAFYQLPTPAFAEKWDYLCAVGLSPLEMQRAYFL